MFIVAAALIIAGVALFVAAPLGIGLSRMRAKSAGELQVERHEHERALAVQGLHELEFDREMGKLSDADYDSMHSALETRALTAMSEVERIRAEATKKQASVVALADAPRRTPTPMPRRTETVPTLVVHHEVLRPPASRKVLFCPQCGMRSAPDANFCAECGTEIKPAARANNRTE